MAILTTAVAGSTAGAADSPATEGTHLYVVPSGADGTAALTASGAAVIARYDSFSVVSAEGAAGATLLAAGADLRDDMQTVATAAGTLEPTAGPTLSAASAGEATLALVQFVGPIKDPWLEGLQSTGARVVTYMAQNAYLVYASGSAVKELAAFADDPAVRAVTPFTAVDKTTPGLTSAGNVAAAIETLSGAPGAAARDIVGARGEKLRADAGVLGRVVQFAHLSAADIEQLADYPGVVGIDAYVAPELHDERAAQIVANKLTGGTVPTAPGYLGFLNQEGFPTSLMNFTIDITDEGIDKGIVPAPAGSHPDFRVNGSGASRLDYAQEATADSNARDCGGHGTNVASIAAGFNNGTGPAVEDAQGFNYALGIAPRARVGATKIFNCAGQFDVQTSFPALVSNAYAEGARVSNNSWGAPINGAYNADSQTYDALVRDASAAQAGNQQMVEIFSAGNSGSGGNTIGAPGTAKNVITVGASESVRGGGTDGCGVTDAGADNAKDIIDFSSRGPTDDGRIKPDIVAPGTHVTGAQPQTGAEYNGSGTCDPQFPAGSTLYTRVSGTSQAAPEVTGFAALIRDWYQREVGAGTAVPSPALTKAIMVNTATDLVGGNNGAGGSNTNIPTQIQGWGRINAKAAFAGTPREYVDQTHRFGASGQSETRLFDVASTTREVKVTLAYSDTPGPTTGNAFVNDLDLVVKIGGLTYKGNVFSGGDSATGGSADPRNNLENVFLPAGESGTFSVEVRATNVAGDGVPGNADLTDQDYALVVSNANPGNGPLLTHVNATGTELASADGDGDLEPGEAFRITERLRNDGNAAATAVTSVLTEAQPALSISQANSAYANIPVGVTRTNTTAFRAMLAGGFTCGLTAEFTLDVTTNQGDFEVPFSVPTGGPAGAAANANSSDVPKTIPTLGTVQSTLTIPAGQAAAIRDLDVRLPTLTHTYDGDLVITLTGPGGAPAATLVNRRGGSGDNFTSTVFDDEAATAISSGSAPFSGSFRPETSLKVFDGLNQSGTWTLRIDDAAAGDGGTLSAWGLRKRTAVCD